VGSLLRRMTARKNIDEKIGKKMKKKLKQAITWYAQVDRYITNQTTSNNLNKDGEGKYENERKEKG